MDTLTHALVGAAVSDSWFRRRLGPAATPFALAMGALPDIDAVTYFISPERAWELHRGITHSFFPMLVAAPLFGYAAYRLTRREGRWQEWTALALLCLFLHTIFDLITTWGTMPLLPFSNARISWDVAPFLDVFLTSVTAASFVVNRILRWERVDTFVNPLAFPVIHRHPRRRRAADRTAMVALVLVTLYLLVGWQQKSQTLRIARQKLAEHGVTATHIRAMPIMFTYIAWDIAAKTADGTIYNAVYSSYARGPMRFIRFDTLPPEDAAPALATPEGRMFAWYSQNMYVTDALPASDGGRILRMHDRRFFGLSDPTTANFQMEFGQDASGAITSARAVQMGLKNLDVRDELQRLWDLMWTGRDMEER